MSDRGKWRIHSVCHVESFVSESADRTAGIDLSICNAAAVSFGDDTLLYPGNVLSDDLHYYLRANYPTEWKEGPSKRAQLARGKKLKQQDHFLHAAMKDLEFRCVEREVGEIAVSHPK